MTTIKNEFIRVASTQDLVPGQGLKIFVGKKSVALFRVNDNVYAVQNACPHRGAPLAAGELVGTQVICPDHAWKFCLQTGQTPEDPECALMVYDVKETGGEIWVSRLPRLQTQ